MLSNTYVLPKAQRIPAAFLADKLWICPDKFKALACVEDVPLAEMWSQGLFIDRRHGLAVVVLVLQSWISVVNLSGQIQSLSAEKQR